MKNIKNKKRTIMIIIIIAAVAAILFYSRIKTNKVSETEPTVVTEEVTRTTLTSSIAATGTIKSKVVTDVTTSDFGETGLKVTGVNVTVGDVASEGDVLCTFDVSDAKDQLTDLKEAQAKEEATEAASKKSAQRAYNSAISSKNTQLEAAQAEIDVAASAVNEAQTALDSLPSEIQEAKSAVTDAENEVYEAEGALASAQNKINELSGEGSTASAEELKAAEDTLAAAQAELKATQKVLSDAEEMYESLTGPQQGQTRKDALNSAEAAYRQAKAEYQTANDAADEAIASAKDALDSANLGSGGSDNSAKAQIRSLQATIDGESLKSPVSGTVTAVNVKKDSTYTGGIVVTIQDTSNLYVEAGIKQADIPDVKEGMEVLIKTDATGEEELKGKVVRVAPTAGTGSSSMTDSTDELSSSMVSSGSGNSYLVEIDLLGQNERLRIDMSAKLSLIKEQKKNVLVVPYDALFTDENGDKTLHVLSNELSSGEADLSITEEPSESDEDMGEYTEIKVETGMESGYYIEILPTPGIEKGTLIIMPSADDSSLDEMDPAGGLG